MQLKVNYFLLGTCCCTRTHTKHTDTLETHSNSIGNLEIFAIFSFVSGRARRTKTSKQNGDTRERTNTERTSAANFVVRAPKLNWLQTQPASIGFTQAARHAALDRLSLEPNLALGVAIEPPVRERTCCSELVQVRVRLVRFGFQFVSYSVRCANLFRSRVRTGFVRALSALSLNYSIMLCASKSKRERGGEGDGEMRSAISWLYFRNLLFYLAGWVHPQGGVQLELSFTLFYNVGAAFITPYNKVELICVYLCAGCLMSVWNLVTLMSGRENLHAWQMFIRCYK